jgi:hypothetical protein
VSKKLEFDWHLKHVTKDSLRVELKHALFKFPLSVVSLYLPDSDFFKRPLKKKLKPLTPQGPEDVDEDP